jgi:hypothetical protein
MAVMLTRMDEHTTMIAQFLSQFQQGRNGHECDSSLRQHKGRVTPAS